MATQLVTPNLDPYIRQPNGKGGTYIVTDWYGWCLAYVQSAFNSGWAGNYAWEAWTLPRLAHEHTGTPPAGVYVPIWFSGYGGQGHVAIYKDGRVWSSPIEHKPYADQWSSIAQVQQKYGVTYAGWSEDIGGTQLISVAAPAPAPSQGGDDMAEKITVDTSRILSWGVLGRNSVAGRAYSLDGTNGGDSWIGQDLTNAFVQGFFLSDESRQWRDSNDPNSINGINGRLSAADQNQAQLDSLRTTIGQLQDAVTSATADDTATKAQLQAALKQVSDLTAELQAQQPPQNTPPPSISGGLKWSAIGDAISKLLNAFISKFKK